MNELFFGEWGVIIWSLFAMVFAFLATWTWMLVFQLGGIRGTAMAILFTGCGITTAGFAILLSRSAVIPGDIVGAIITAVWWPNTFAAFVLGDLYAADRNGHRSFVTKIYLWFADVVNRHNDGNKGG